MTKENSIVKQGEGVLVQMEWLRDCITPEHITYVTVGFFALCGLGVICGRNVSFNSPVFSFNIA